MDTYINPYQLHNLLKVLDAGVALSDAFYGGASGKGRADEISALGLEKDQNYCLGMGYIGKR